MSRASAQISLPSSLLSCLPTFQARPAEENMKEDQIIGQHDRLRLTPGRGGRVREREGKRGQDSEAADAPVDIEL